MTEKKPEFAFEKKLGIHEILYGDIQALLKIIGMLLYCVKETNQSHGTSCEFFRLDFRQMYLDEKFPFGSMVLDLKFGSKKEVDENLPKKIEKK
jgi:hypothetical protein